MESTKGKVKEHVRGANGKMIALPKVTMGFDNILTSCELPDYGSLIAGSDLPDPRQVVVAAGENSPWKVGDIIHLNFLMFPYESKPAKHDLKPTREIRVPEVVVDKRTYIYCTNRHVMWKYDSKA